jgi:hypothetical protein
MRILEIKRGASKVNFKASNGDLYGDTGKLYNHDTSLLWECHFVNSDKTLNYKGGILSAGVYYGIVAYRESGKRVIKLFDRKTDWHKIKTDKDIPENSFYLLSDIPNINQNNKNIMSFVQVHAGGITWDYSHGCITILNTPPAHFYDMLMLNFDDNEIIIVQLK